MKITLFFLFLAYFASGVFAQAPEVKIVPQPSSLTLNGGYINFKSPVDVYVDPRAGLNLEYVEQILKGMGIEPMWVAIETQGLISFLLTEKGEKRSEECYEIEVGASESDKVLVSSVSRKGLLHGLQTLRQLAKKGVQQITFPRCRISDSPTFSWRAYMLDESRNFQGKEVVKNLLDEMARLKLNIFHWHLVDDPAWRLEIQRYPRLTGVASKGDFGHMNRYIDSKLRWDSLFVQPPAQFYTQKDIKEIVTYADLRGISVLPEIELPGHVSASVYAYPWLGSSSKILGKGVHGDLYDVTDPKVEQFIHHVLDEMIHLFPGGLIHIGGDEANYKHWKDAREINLFMKKNNIPTYADLQVWAINRLSKYISAKGYRMIGWNEITGDNIRGDAHVEASKSESLAHGTIVQFWDGDLGLVNKAIEKGYDVVNSDRHHTYLDYSYDTIPFEKAYSFNPIPQGLAEKDKNKILGLGCQMWGEYTPTTERLFYQTFPRIAAYAEVGWVPSEKKASYQEFRERLKGIEEIWRAKGYIQHQNGKY
jgi:hexosaminidase